MNLGGPFLFYKKKLETEVPSMIQISSGMLGSSSASTITISFAFPLLYAKGSIYFGTTNNHKAIWVELNITVRPY